MNVSDLIALLQSATPEERDAIRAATLGPGVALDDAGNLGVGGNLTAAGRTIAGSGLALKPITVAELDPNAGFQLVADALNPVIGQPVVSGGFAACLVGNDSGAMRVLAKY